MWQKTSPSGNRGGDQPSMAMSSCQFRAGERPIPIGGSQGRLRSVAFLKTNRGIQEVQAHSGCSSAVLPKSGRAVRVAGTRGMPYPDSGHTRSRIYADPGSDPKNFPFLRKSGLAPALDPGAPGGPAGGGCHVGGQHCSSPHRGARSRCRPSCPRGRRRLVHAHARRQRHSTIIE